jgi:hypothetical protein
MIKGRTNITMKNEHNVTVEWLALHLCIREVTGSNPGPDLSYPDRCFAVFHSPPKPMPGYLKLGHHHFLMSFH